MGGTCVPAALLGAINGMCAHWRSMAGGGDEEVAARGVFRFAVTPLVCRRLALQSGRQL